MKEKSKRVPVMGAVAIGQFMVLPRSKVSRARAVRRVGMHTNLKKMASNLRRIGPIL